MEIIELYVKSEKRLKPHPDRDYSIYAEHPCQVKYNIMKTLSAADLKALEMLTSMAEEKGLTLRVYDLSNFKGKLKALMRGITKTPVLVVGAHKINGVPKMEELLKVL
jgi:protein-disulfide isomerase